MLKAQVIAAMRSLVTALDDLVIDVQHVLIGMPAHVPGTAPVPTETLYSTKIVITSYTIKEVALLGDRIQSADRQGVLLPIDGSILNPPPKPNDLIRNGSTDYRIVAADHIQAGDSVVASVLQLRPT